MATLERAVPGGDHHDVAVPVGEALGLDVPRAVEVLLHEALAAPEGTDRLADRRLVELGDLLLLASHLEPAAAAAEGGLDRDRQAVLLGEGDDLVRALDRVLRAGDQRGPDLLRDVPGLHLVAEGVDGRGRGADPDEAGVEDRLGEARVLGEEAVAGVHRVRARLLGDRDDLLDVEVGVRGSGAVEAVRLVGQPHEERVPVGLRVDRHTADAGVLAGPDDPDRDLAAVGDQDLLQRLDLGRTGHGGLSSFVGALRRSLGERPPGVASRPSRCAVTLPAPVPAGSAVARVPGWARHPCATCLPTRTVLAGTTSPSVTATS